MKKLYGIILCFILALIAHYLGKIFPLIGAPVMAIFIGMILHNIVVGREEFSSGLKFTSKKILKLAIILLGFRLSLNQVWQSGKLSLPIIISTIATALIVAYFLSKKLNIKRNIGILIGVGSSICGGSAIAATAPVINADDEEIAQSIAIIFLFNIIAALTFPSLGALLAMSNQGFAIFAGTAINDTSSVTAAASVWDTIHQSSALEIATVTKLTRTLAIIPITLALSIYENKRTASDKKLHPLKLVPLFIVLFLLASLIATMFTLPASLLDNLKLLSKFFITMAMVSIGLNTDVIKLVKTGGKSIVLGLICWLSIAFVSIGVQLILGIL